MQDNSQPTGYDGQGQNNLYDDQKTFPFEQAPTSPYIQETVPFAQSSEAPTLSYAQGTMQQGTLQAETLPHKKRQVPKKILIGGAIGLIVLLVGGAVLLPKLAANANSQGSISTPVAVSTPATGTKPASGNIYTPYLARYRVAIQSQIAQGLHLSTDQLTTQLNAGGTLSSIATAQGISDSQLQTIVTNAFQSSFQPTIRSGDLTQKQVDSLVKRMLKQSKTLDRFLTARVKKAAGTTPGGTATAVAQ